MQRFAGWVVVCSLCCLGCGGRASDAPLAGPVASPPFFATGGRSGTVNSSPPTSGAASMSGGASAGSAAPVGTGGSSVGGAAGSGGSNAGLAGSGGSGAGLAGSGGSGAGSAGSGGLAGEGGTSGLGASGGGTGAAVGGALFSEVGSLTATGTPAQLVYAASYSTLLARDESGRIDVIDLSSGQSISRTPATHFVDMSLSPDGRYLYASDYGGENIGYSTPLNPSYVHRLDLAGGAWAVKAAYIAGNIQVTSSDEFVLKTMDQWITFTLNSWGVGVDVTPLSSVYAVVYFGDFRFDARTQRLIHGNTNLSSQEIQAFEIVDHQIEPREGSGAYGSASGYGPSVALATDGSAFYYGSLSVDALDVTRRLLDFPEVIFAASADTAFGENAYYDAHTGTAISNLGFHGRVYGLNPGSGDFWAFDPGAGRLRHFEPVTTAVGADAGAP